MTLRCELYTDENRRVRNQDFKTKEREELNREKLKRLETMVYAQHEKLDRLENLVYRVMHRDQDQYKESLDSSKYEEDYSGAEQTDETASTSWQSEINDQDIPENARKGVTSTR